MLRRPMMYITSLFAASILTAHYYSAFFALAMTGAGALFLFYLRRFSLSDITVLLLTASMVSGNLCYIFHDEDKSRLEEHVNENISACFLIVQMEIKDSAGFDGRSITQVRLEAKASHIDGQKTEDGEKVLISHYDDEDNITYRPGDRIEVSGTIEKPEGRRNPGCFDYSLYLSSVGINYIMTADSITVCEKTDESAAVKGIFRQVCSYLYSVKEKSISGIEEYSGKKVSGLMRAIMFGDTSELDEDILEEFRRNGTAHVLAVSGLHIGIIYGFLSAVWVWKKGKVFFVLIVLFFMAYMVMSSFSPSVVRAVIMVWLHIFANLTNKRYDMASAAFFTALVMLVNNPMHIFNVGFQMSFLAVLTLALLLPVIKHFYRGVFLMSAAVQIGLLPYTVYVFNYFSLAAVVVNVPVIYLTGVIVPTGMCYMFFTAVSKPLAMVTAKVLGGLCMMLEEINSATCIEGMTVFDVRSPDVWLIALYYLVLLVFVSEDGRLVIMRKRKALLGILSVFVLSLSLLFGIAAGNHYKNSDMVFVDVGQGDCIHIRTDNGMFTHEKNYLIDGGGSINYEVGSKTLKPYLLKNGVKKIDAAFVTHLHTDHYKGIAELCREGMIERLYVYEGYSARETEIIENTGLTKDKITYLYAGQKVMMGNDSYGEILWPDAASIREYERLTADETDENSLCLIMKITVKNKSVLVTGDVDSACLDALAARYGEALDTDILTAAHHGSRYSDSENFAEAAEPEHVVFQVGKNNFGHPDEGVIENFRQKGIMIYRNDKNGAVAFDIDKRGCIKGKTVKGER